MGHLSCLCRAWYVVITLAVLTGYYSIDGTVPVFGQETASPTVTVLVSENIRPFVEAAEGLNRTLENNADAQVDMISLERYKGRDRLDLTERLSKEDSDLIIAIGPSAATFIWQESVLSNRTRLYAVVMNPDRVPGLAKPKCGIPLNILVETQLKMVTQGFPSVRRLGLLYDPSQNAEFVNKAMLKAGSGDLKIVPLEVSSKKDIRAKLDAHWKDMDALWLIPDYTVTGSDSIVQYIIKEALYHKMPVIGYNRFFYESGAAMAFVFDYVELGRQCAEEALRVLAGHECRSVAPVFEVWVNIRVIRRLDLEQPGEYLPPIKLGP